MKNIPILILMLCSLKSFAQTDIPLVESAIGLSQPQLVTYLRGVLNGAEPKRAPNTDKVAYTLDNAYIHIDYYITNDSCLSAGIHFKDAYRYKNTEQQISSTCPSKGNNTYFKISTNKRIIYYILSDENLNIVALDKSAIHPAAP